MDGLAVVHRLPQRSLSGVVGGFDALDFKEGPEGFLVFAQLAAGAHRSDPGRCLSSLAAQIHPSLQRHLKRQPESAGNIAPGCPKGQPGSFP